MAEVDTIVLDKTGTLTDAGRARRGILQTANAESGNGFDRRRKRTGSPRWRGIRRIRNSVRIAKALARGDVAGGRFQGNAGLRHRRRNCRAQNPAGLARVAGATRRAARRRQPEPSPARAVFVAMDGKLRGAFALENSLRPEVAQLMAQLGGRFELALLSGDNEREAARFQKLFGERAILRFNQSPADKLNFIRELQQRGRKVMMVGDGLNDAGRAEAGGGRRGGRRTDRGFFAGQRRDSGRGGIAAAGAGFGVFAAARREWCAPALSFRRFTIWSA